MLLDTKHLRLNDRGRTGWVHPEDYMPYRRGLRGYNENIELCAGIRDHVDEEYMRVVFDLTYYMALNKHVAFGKVR